MKKQFGIIAALLTFLANAQVPAIALNWFEKYDRDHDHRWNWDEFRAAHRSYWKQHQDEKRMNDDELRAEFDRRSAEHHTWVDMEQVKDFHHW